jgi:hypothetical protein
MLIVCASLSGAPGVSALAAGLAAGWPGGPALLLEADPAGGVLAARFGLAQRPGLTSLAAQMRHGAAADAAPHVQHLPLACPVVVAPGSAETTCGTVSVLGQHAGLLRELAPVVVTDVGRLYVGSPASALVAAADAVLLLVAPATEQLDHADTRIPGLREVARWRRLGVVVAGKSPYSMAEIAEKLGAPVWGQMPRDRWGAGALTGQLTDRGWTRTRLARACRDLAGHLTAVAGEPDMNVSVQGALR